VRQLEDQPCLGDALHPDPHLRHDLPRQEHAEIAMRERAETGGGGHRPSSLHRATPVPSRGRSGVFPPVGSGEHPKLRGPGSESEEPCLANATTRPRAYRKLPINLSVLFARLASMALPRKIPMALFLPIPQGYLSTGSPGHPQDAAQSFGAADEPA